MTPEASTLSDNSQCKFPIMGMGSGIAGCRAMSSETQTLWIADTNYIHGGYIRRYVLGLAAHTHRSLSMPITQYEREVPRRLSLAASKHWLTKKSRRTGQPLIKADLLTGASACLPEFKDMLARWRSLGKVNILRPDEALVDGVLLETDEMFTNKEGERTHDAFIVAEAVSAGCVNIATDNMSTMDHEKLNAWWAGKGHNEPLILSLPRLSELLVRNPFEELCIVAAMCKSERRRSNRDEIESVLTFVRSLERGRQGRLAIRLRSEIETEGILEQAIREAALWITQPRWKGVRGMEMEINDVGRKALAQANLIELHPPRQRDGDSTADCADDRG